MSSVWITRNRRRYGSTYLVRWEHWHRDAATGKANSGRIRWHDLRHTWATRYMEATGDLFGLMHLGGWTSVNAVQQYQHLTSIRRDRILTLDFGLNSAPSPHPEALPKQKSI